MRYINISEYGGPEVMEIKEGNVPDPGKGEVLIKVHAAGVNRPDVMQRKGLYPPPPGASPVLGLEVAGEVTATGNEVSAWSVSDRACALTNGGGYAEYVSVPAGQCLPVPAGLSLEEAAALPETFFTVWSNVFDRARLKPGERFLVHGGSSGIGMTAIQMARSLGSKVYTTAGSKEKCAACRHFGADVAVNYHEQDYVKVLKEATEGQGVDVILDIVGGDYVARNLELAAKDGRIVNVCRGQSKHRRKFTRSNLAADRKQRD
jgi:NADPH2:quinone reductase